MNKNAVIIVAGGKGSRMNSLLPKQYICLGNKPILMHTIERFLSSGVELNVVVVLLSNDHEYWSKLCEEYNFTAPHILAKGGSTRFESVKNGLLKLKSEKYVAIHDGVRPFVSRDVIKKCFDVVKESKAVIPVLPVFETLRNISQDKTVDRDDYCVVQTPQVFQLSLLSAAYSQPYNVLFTDDASVVEAYGYKVTRVDGNRENIKMTTPFDLKLGEVLLND